MTLLQLEALLQAGDMNKCIEILDTYCLFEDTKKFIEQYLPEHHIIHDKVKRKDKRVKKEDGCSKTIPVARLSLPLQKRIVMVAVAFLGTPDIQSTPEGDLQDKFLKIVKKIYSGNKLDYKFKNEATIGMSEGHVAELWFTKPAENGYWDEYDFQTNLKPTPLVLAESLGDKLYPLYDEYGDMIAFGRSYNVTTLIDNSVKEVKHFDIYTASVVYQTKNEDGTWYFNSVTAPDVAGNITSVFTTDFAGIPNPVGKIPVTYKRKTITEWHDVQHLIDRLEKIISNHADTNDYFANPIVFAEGAITGFADKGEEGKILKGENGAKVSYLTWNNAPESSKMEIDNLLRFIYGFTSTPDISFEQMKSLGQATSGTALNMLFMDAHLKASNNEEIYGEFVQRRNNYLKSLVVTLDKRYTKAANLEITPKFTYFLPPNIQEQVTILTSAIAGGILSTESGIEQNPLVGDAEAEKKRIEAENAPKDNTEEVDPVLPVPVVDPKIQKVPATAA